MKKIFEKVTKTPRIMKVAISLCIIAIVVIIMHYTTRGFASGTAFSYNVGTTFTVDGYTFVMVDKTKRLAIAKNKIMDSDWGDANDFAKGFGQSYSFIRSSGLPGHAVYNNATYRGQLTGLTTTTFEWTSTPCDSENSGRFWSWYSSGAYLSHNITDYSSGVRPALYLKSGLYISGTTLYEPLPGTFGNLTIQ